MAIAERGNVEERSRPYDKLLIATIAAFVALGVAGFFLSRALPGSPALRCVGFVVFGTTVFIAGTAWWQIALTAIGHSKSVIPTHIAQSLGALIGLVFGLAAAEFALFAWTQSRVVEGVFGVVASLIGFTFIGRFETKHLSPPTSDQGKRLRSVGRMFALISLFIVVDLVVGLTRPVPIHFETYRDAILALEFATAPALLVGAWFVRRRATQETPVE